MKLRVAITLLVVSFAVPLLHGQQPTFRSQVDTIEIDAVVTDSSGRPVENLTAADFQLLENGTPQTIHSFGLVTVPLVASRPAVADAAVQTNTDSDGRLFVIALGNMPAYLALRTRDVLRHFIVDHVAANDLVSIVSIGSSTARDAQDFTADKRLLLRALDSFDGSIRNPFTTRMQGDTLRDLLESIGQIPHRRKALLYVTSATFDIADVIRGSETGEAADLRPLRDGLAIAMRGNVAIYPIDPVGLRGAGLGADEGAVLTPSMVALERDTDLKIMADITGGFALVNSNRYADAFQRIVQENSTYYMLGFSSTNTARDGKFRRLEIRVTRRDLVVHVRQGYIAPGEKDILLHTLKPIGVQFGPAVAEALERPVEDGPVPMWVTASASSPAADTESIVVVSAELDAAALATEADVQVELGVVAVSADGTLVRAQRERFAAVPVTAGADGRRIRGTTSLRLPPGRYQLRVAGGNVDAGRAGSVLYDLEVPAPPRRTKWRPLPVHK